MGRKDFLVALSALAVILAGGALAQMHESEKGMPGHVMVTPDQVQWSDATSIGPGVKIAVLEGTMKNESPFTALIKFPANFKVPAHTHPVTERVTVLSGNFHLGIGEEFDRAKAKTLPPGSVALMQPGVAMFAYTEDEESVIQLHGTGPWGITYLNPGESPAVKKWGGFCFPSTKHHPWHRSASNRNRKPRVSNALGRESRFLLAVSKRKAPVSTRTDGLERGGQSPLFFPGHGKGWKGIDIPAD